MKESIKQGIVGNSRKNVLYPLLHDYMWYDKRIPDAVRQDVLLMAAREWEQQGWPQSPTEAWERRGSEIAREILRAHDPEWAEGERKRQRGEIYP